MSFLKYIERLKRMDQLIRRRSTGTADEFADKMGICRSVLMDHLREMKDMGAPIAYCKIHGSYYYAQECRLKLCFDKEELREVKGGFNYQCHIPERLFGGKILPL